MRFLNQLESVICKTNLIIARITEWILGCLFAVLIVILAINVVCRYVLKEPLFWVMELACYLLVYLIFLGASLALYRGEHISVDIRMDRLPAFIRKVFLILSISLTYLFIVLMIIFGAVVSFRNLRSYTGTLPVPMGLVYMAAPISGIMMLLQHTEATFKRLKG